MFRIALAAAALALAGCTTDPGAREQTSTAQTGWNTAALAEVTAYVQSQDTTGFLIVQDGKTIVEHNWPLKDDAASQTFGANFVHGQAAYGALREDVASQQKSFVALLVGIGVDKGVIDIEKPVSSYIGAGWSKASPEQEAVITVRHLLEMNSGLKENLTYEAPAGEKFFYNTPAYAKLKPVLEKSSGQDLGRVTELWLTQPLNLRDTKWEMRPRVFADVGNPTGLVTTPRDIAVMGQLVLDRGMHAGKRIISEQQLDAMLTPTRTNPAYARLWWVNSGAYSLNAGAEIRRREGRFIASAPRDLVAALGAQDRKLFVVPSQKLIVVRTGRAAPDRGFDEKLWRLLTNATAQP